MNLKTRRLIVVFLLISSCKVAKEADTVYLSLNESYHPKPLPQLTGKLISPYRPLAQFGKDSLRYIKFNFEDRKEAYINKPLDTLLRDLELPVINYYDSQPVNYSFDPSTCFFFDNYSVSMAKLRSHQKLPSIEITWKVALSRDSTNALRRILDWKNSSRKFYGKQLIGNIETNQ